VTVALDFARFVGVVALATVRNPPPVAATLEDANRNGVRSLPIL
jgi:hypothetical protein